MTLKICFTLNSITVCLESDKIELKLANSKNGTLIFDVLRSKTKPNPKPTRPRKPFSAPAAPDSNGLVSQDTYAGALRPRAAAGPALGEDSRRPAMVEKATGGPT